MELIAFWSELWEWVSIGFGLFILVICILIFLGTYSFREMLSVIGGLAAIMCGWYLLKWLMDKSIIFCLILLALGLSYAIGWVIWLIIQCRKDKKQRQELKEENLKNEIENQTNKYKEECKRHRESLDNSIKMSDKLELAEEELEKSKKFSAEKMKEIREMRKVIEIKDREIKRLISLKNLNKPEELR